jgi:hypothetical protein
LAVRVEALRGRGPSATIGTSGPGNAIFSLAAARRLGLPLLRLAEEEIELSAGDLAIIFADDDRLALIRSWQNGETHEMYIIFVLNI